MMRKHNTAKLPILHGMSEHALAYCLINNQELATPWIGGDDKHGVMRWNTIDFIVECRADGLTEREVIREARRHVREWFESGLRPDPIAPPAVRVLAHSVDEYPITSKERFAYILTVRGYGASRVEELIDSAVRDGKIKAVRGRRGFVYSLAREPITREINDLAERVPPMMTKYPGGVPFRELRHTAARVLYRGTDSGAALIERALNAGVLRAEIRGDGWRRERFIFPKTKTKKRKGQPHAINNG